MSVPSNCPHCAKADTFYERGGVFYCKICGGAFNANGEPITSFETLMNNAKDVFQFEGSVLKKYIGNESTVIIPSFIETIDEGAFKKCKGIKSLTIPESVKAIQYSAFEECSGTGV